MFFAIREPSGFKPPPVARGSRSSSVARGGGPLVGPPEAPAPSRAGAPLGPPGRDEALTKTNHNPLYTATRHRTSAGGMLLSGPSSRPAVEVTFRPPPPRLIGSGQERPG